MLTREAHAISKEVAENLGLGGRANGAAVGSEHLETKCSSYPVLATRPKFSGR
jgi:hypothetical protein